MVQVFHELARHLQTRRLIAGDSLSLEEDKSFYCVVDGLVKVYTRTPGAVESHSNFEEDGNGFQLLNEVGSGGTLSSLFTILSLFTEDVRMSWQDGTSEHGPDVDSDLRSPPRTRANRSDSDVSRYTLDDDPARQLRRESISSDGSTVLADYQMRTSPTQPSRLSSNGTEPSRASSLYGHDRGRTQPVHHGTVAVAVEDTTLAVIPAEAFRRLTKNFPKASAHIVQGSLALFFFFSEESLFINIFMQ